MILHLVLAAASLGVTRPELPPPVSRQRAPWAEFSRTPSRGAPPVAVMIGTAAHPVRGRLVYWARRRDRSGLIDSLGCPALANVVEDLRGLELPAPRPDGSSATLDDGTAYSLTLPASWPGAASGRPLLASSQSRITFTFWQGPASDWVDNALTRLEPCWATH